jgi:hypothetical protein
MGNWRGSIRTKKEEFYVHVFNCVWNGEKRLSLYKDFIFTMIWLLYRDNGNINNKTKNNFFFKCKNVWVRLKAQYLHYHHLQLIKVFSTIASWIAHSRAAPHTLTTSFFPFNFFSFKIFLILFFFHFNFFYFLLLIFFIL